MCHCLKDQLAKAEIMKIKLDKKTQLHWDVLKAQLAREAALQEYDVIDTDEDEFLDLNPEINLTQAVAAFERQKILNALEKYHWNRVKAANMLGITRRILGYKISLLKLEELKT
jgi:transcriptional regulator with GAF, ATPase, and Fis domain